MRWGVADRNVVLDDDIDQIRIERVAPPSRGEDQGAVVGPQARGHTPDQLEELRRRWSAAPPPAPPALSGSGSRLSSAPRTAAEPLAMWSSGARLSRQNPAEAQRVDGKASSSPRRRSSSVAGSRPA